VSHHFRRRRLIKNTKTGIGKCTFRYLTYLIKLQCLKWVVCESYIYKLFITNVAVYPAHILARNLQSCLQAKNGSKHPSQWYNIPHFAHWWLHACSVVVARIGSHPSCNCYYADSNSSF
jgi:hypothetical protein